MVKQIVKPLPRVKIVKRRSASPSRNYLAMLIVSLIGSIFSGILSYYAIAKNSCILNEGCISLVGSPVFFFLFALYFLVFILSLVSTLSKINFVQPMRFMSLIGVFLSLGYFLYILLFSSVSIFYGFNYTLFLPSFFYDFILFLVLYSLNN